MRACVCVRTHVDRQTDMTDHPPDGIVLIARGIPRPQPRPRLLASGRIISAADKNAKAWIATVERSAFNLMESIGGKQALRHYITETDPLSVRMLFRFPIGSGRNPKLRGRSIGSPHLSVPDADNLAKLVLDCMTRRGLLMGDDSRVAILEVVKVWDIDDKGRHGHAVQSRHPESLCRLPF